MKISELRAACTAINPLDGKPVEHIYLTLPRSRLPQGATIRFLGRRGPRGKLCTVKEEGDGFACVAVFKTAEILALIKDQSDEKETT